jgi:hypothetical protein
MCPGTKLEGRRRVSNPAAPNSGSRRNGLHAIEAYLQTKSVMISTARDVADPFIMR